MTMTQWGLPQKKRSFLYKPVIQGFYECRLAGSTWNENNLFLYIYGSLWCISQNRSEVEMRRELRLGLGELRFKNTEMGMLTLRKSNYSIRPPNTDYSRFHCSEESFSVQEWKAKKLKLLWGRKKSCREGKFTWPRGRMCKFVYTCATK